MTRFARAKGSKSSNERLPEQPTPWHEMKRQLLEKNEESENWEKIQAIRKERQANYDAFLEEIETEKTRNGQTTKWAEFPEVGNVSKNKQKNGKKDSTKSLINGTLIEGAGKSLIDESKDGANSSGDNKSKSGKGLNKNETIQNLEQSGNDNKTKINKKNKKKKALKVESQAEIEDKTEIKTVDEKQENETMQMEVKENEINQVNKSEQEKKTPKKKRNKRKPKPNDSKNEDLNKNQKEDNQRKKEKTNKRKFEEESETANAEGKNKSKKVKIDETEAKDPENLIVGKNSKPSKKQIQKSTKKEIQKNPQTTKKNLEDLSETELMKVEKKKQKKLRQLERRKLRKLEQQTQKPSQETPEQNSANSQPKSSIQNSEPKSPAENSKPKSLAQNTPNPVEGSKQNSSTKKPKKIRIKDNEAQKDRRKPQQNSMNINGEEVEIAYFDGFPIKRSDFERLKQLKRKLIGKGVPRSEIQRTMKLERRRAEKMFAREKKKLCFNCRQSGHVLSECPKLNDTNQAELSGIDHTGVEICFKCGSTEHRQLDCKVVKGDSFRYATCFVCKEQGHLARQCPDNARGLYPNGGACRLCGDVTHLKKDCPKYLNEQQENSYYGGMVRSNQNPDGLDDDDNEMGCGGVNKKINFNSKPVNKIIKF